MATTTPGLAERLARIQEPGEGLSVVLDRALAVSGVERGLVVFRVGERYHTIASGFADEETVGDVVRRDGSELGAAIRAGGRARVPAPGGGDDELLLIPLNDPDPWGAIVLDGGVSEEEAEEVESVFVENVPFLESARRLRDLEERSRSLESERDLFRNIVDGLPDPVVLTDSASTILETNARAEDLFFAGPDASEGRRRAVQLNDLLFTSFLTRFTSEVEGESGDRELNLVDPSDGSDLMFEALPATITMPSAEDRHLFILRDITDLKRAVSEMEAQYKRSRVAEERVREEWQRLKATLENVGDPILVTDARSNIILMNRQAERLFESDGSYDSPEQRAVRANDTKFTGLISDFLLEPGTRRVETFELHAPQERTTFPVEVVSSKIMNARGEASAIVSVIHDLTQVVENERLAAELKQLNEELEDRIQLATVELEERNRRLEWQSRELEKASRLKSEFLASMSHELRTPINAVLGYTSLMREQIYGSLTDKQKSGLDKINTASQHLLDLINDILDLSKIEAGKMPVYLEEVSLKHLVSELAEAVEPLAREQGVDLRVEVDPAIPPMFTDRTKLKQILLNLLSNAVKFTEDGEVRLIARPRGERVAIAVEDTGIGIRESDLENIFDDFRQVDQSPTREYGGTGLGLSITRKLVALLEGALDVESTYGEGSCFTVVLPFRLDPGTREAQMNRALVAGDEDGSEAEAPDPGAG
ncbi:MAG: PAS domain S-box protein [Gammaproteobacteria bacterium]|nr:PAS domain S-box protein [Gemmatimonadota bacterium]NIU77964.1 PAS domain S-box protein [Gammaproteobacteria bacterium]NIY11415.1 PAS domain S-box protein [Gemmatimonadota bacterium]